MTRFAPYVIAASALALSACTNPYDPVLRERLPPPLKKAAKPRRAPDQRPSDDAAHDMLKLDPDPAEMAARYLTGTAVLDWRERLVCYRCGNRQVDMVVSRGK